MSQPQAPQCNAYWKYVLTEVQIRSTEKFAEKYLKKTDCRATMGRRSNEEGVAERLGSIKNVHKGTAGTGGISTNSQC
jgi:hypothetical protein